MFLSESQLNTESASSTFLPFVVPTLEVLGRGSGYLLQRIPLLSCEESLLQSCVS